MSTPAMGLTLPVVGVTPGATAGTNIVDNFTIIDTHDHSTGKGVQIPAAGLNINAALSFGNQKAFNMAFLQLNSQIASPTGSSDRPNLHVLNGNLFYTNASGTAVQITNAGSLAGTSGSIGGLTSPASAQFATNTFTWQATATLYAKHALSDLTIYPFTASPSTALTLRVNNSVTNYTLTLPDAPPATTQPLSMTSGGVVAPITYDAIGTNMTSTGANAIAASRTRTTAASVSAGGVAISTGSGAFATTSASFVDVVNPISLQTVQVTITTSGRPVQLMLISEPGNLGTISAATSTANACNARFQFLRDAVVVSQYLLEVSVPTGTSCGTVVPASSLQAIDAVAAGTYTYKIQARRDLTGSTAFVSFARLVAYEL